VTGIRVFAGPPGPFANSFEHEKLHRKTIQDKYKIMKTLIAIIITFVVTALVIVGVGVALKSKAAAKKPTIVRVEKPVPGSLIEFINAPGIVEPKHKVEISAKISARIVELPFDVRAKVTKGDPNANPPIAPSVLLRLDGSDLEAELRSTEASYAARTAQIDVAKTEIESRKASLKGTRSALEQAQRDLQRKKTLLNSQDVSESEVDQIQRQVDELRAQFSVAENGLKAAELGLVISQHNLQAAEAEIARARQSLSYTTITSPIDGVVTKVNVEVGEIVTGTINNPGTVIIEVADLSQMLLIAQVDESDISGVKMGQHAKVRIQAWQDKVFEGVVEAIAMTPVMDTSGSKYFEVKILLETDGQQLFSGLTADVDIETFEHENVLKIPSQAVLGQKVDDLPLKIRENSPEVDEKKTFVPVVYRYIDSEATVTPVKIGKSDATHTIILSGITAEDQIVVGPYKELEKIKHEQKIKDEREKEEEEKKEKEKQKEEK
jgi:HlyD family secretion protein